MRVGFTLSHIQRPFDTDDGSTQIATASFFCFVHGHAGGVQPVRTGTHAKCTWPVAGYVLTVQR